MVKDNDKANEMSGLSRRAMLAGAGIGAGLVVTAGARSVSAQAAAPAAMPNMPTSGNYVIENAAIISLDDTVGTLQKGAIHIRDGVIVEVAKTIQAPDAERIDGTGMIVTPGLCDSHWHMWNSLFKNMVRPDRPYYILKEILGPHHTPHDYYVANQLALTEAIDAGITSVLNYAHNVRSPEHADKEIEAMFDSGLRGRYGYGGFDPTPIDESVDLDDFRRIHDKYFSDGGFDPTGRLGLTMASRSASNAPGTDARINDYTTGRDIGVPLAVHSGQSFARIIPPTRLTPHDLVDERTIFIHGILLTDEDMDIIQEKGATVSISFGNEFRSQKGGDVRQQAMKFLDRGINVSLSSDASSLNPTSLFEQMRLAFAVVCPHQDTPTADMKAITPMQCLEWGSRNGVRALGFGDVSGTLTPGKKADLCILNAKALNMAPASEELDKVVVHSAMRQNVDTVIVDGEFLKWRGALVKVDAEQVRQDAIESLYNVRKRAGGDVAPPTDSVPVI